MLFVQQLRCCSQPRWLMCIGPCSTFVCSSTALLVVSACAAACLILLTAAHLDALVAVLGHVLLLGCGLWRVRPCSHTPGTFGSVTHAHGPVVTTHRQLHRTPGSTRLAPLTSSGTEVMRLPPVAHMLLLFLCMVTRSALITMAYQCCKTPQLWGGQCVAHMCRTVGSHAVQAMPAVMVRHAGCWL